MIKGEIKRDGEWSKTSNTLWIPTSVNKRAWRRSKHLRSIWQRIFLNCDESLEP